MMLDHIESEHSQRFETKTFPQGWKRGVQITQFERQMWLKNLILPRQHRIAPLFDRFPTPMSPQLLSCRIFPAASSPPTKKKGKQQCNIRSPLPTSNHLTFYDSAPHHNIAQGNRRRSERKHCHFRWEAFDRNQLIKVMIKFMAFNDAVALTLD